MKHCNSIALFLFLWTSPFCFDAEALIYLQEAFLILGQES